MHPKAATLDKGDSPYFLIEKRNGHFETRGQHSAEFGHRLDSPASAATEGIFASWHWNGTRLVVHNDRYGIYPLFWYRPPDGGIGISSSLTKLVEQGAPTELDMDALAVLFRLGCFVGDDTPFAAIKTVPPNAAFEWASGKLQCHGRYPKIPSASAISRDEAIDRYIDLFAKAMAKRRPISGKFAVPVTGGRDSRHILLELHRTGIEPTVCVSALDNPPDPNLDPKVGELLCREIGFKHVIVDQKLSLLSAETRKNCETHFCAPAHGWYLALAEYLNGRFDDIYDGLGGDVLSQSSFLTPDLDASFRSQDVAAITAKLLFGGMPEKPVLKSLLKRSLQKSISPQVAKRRLAREVGKHLDMPNPIASFFFWNRTRRMTALAPFSLLPAQPRAYAPFLDHELFDFMNTLPSNMLLDRTFHDDAIARAYPDFAHIPYADDKATPPADDRRIRARFVNEATRRFLVQKPWSLMDNIVPRARLLAGFLSCGYIQPWIPLWIVYLDQIESVINGQPRSG